MSVITHPHARELTKSVRATVLVFNDPVPASCWSASSAWRPARPTRWSSARPAPVRSWWRAISMPSADAAAARSSRSTAVPSPRAWWRASCSATRRAPLPVRCRARPAGSRRPTAAPCSSTRSATCRRASRSSCCACCRSARWCGSVRAGRSPSTCGWWRRPTSTWPTRWSPGTSARTCSTACTWRPSNCRRCASAAAISCRWPSTSSSSTAGASATPARA